MSITAEKGRFLSFLITGGIAAGANLAARLLLQPVMSYAAAVALAYLVGMAVAFLLARWFVFRGASGSVHGQFTRFALVNAVAFLQVWLISVGLAEWLFPAIGFTWRVETVAHVLGVVSPTFSSYLLHKHFSFRRSGNGLLRPEWRPWVVVGGLVLAGCVLAVVLGAYRMEAWTQIIRLVHGLQLLAVSAPWAAALLYILAYAALMAACLPIGPAMSMAGGALLGFANGTLCAMLGITLGCAICFLAVRTGFGAAIKERQGGLFARVQPRLETDGVFALLALRLVPVVPSWMLNFASALAGMRLLPFIGVTALGVLPATMVFSSTGAGFAGALNQHGPPDPGMLLRPQVVLPLLGLSVLALAPILIRWLRPRR